MSGNFWGHKPDTMERIRDWIFRGGRPVPREEYYLHAILTFEVNAGPHAWIGIGEQRQDGDLIRFCIVL